MLESVHFESAGRLLCGTLHRPSASGAPLVIGLHGLLSDRTSPKQLALAARCIAGGLAYLRFDHRGCGESQGDIATDTTFDGRCGDLVAAVAWVHGHISAGTPLGLFGSSYGGAVALAMGNRVKAQALVTVAAPVRSSTLGKAIADPVAPVVMKEPGFSQRVCFDITRRLKTLHHLLLFHGDRDAIVPISHAHEIFAAAQEPKRLCVQQNGDHRMSDPQHQSHFIDVTAAWFADHLK